VSTPVVHQGQQKSTKAYKVCVQEERLFRRLRCNEGTVGAEDTHEDEHKAESDSWKVYKLWLAYQTNRSSDVKKVHEKVAERPVQEAKGRQANRNALYTHLVTYIKVAPVECGAKRAENW